MSPENVTSPEKGGRDSDIVLPELADPSPSWPIQEMLTARGGQDSDQMIDRQDCGFGVRTHLRRSERRHPTKRNDYWRVVRLAVVAYCSTPEDFVDHHGNSPTRPWKASSARRSSESKVKVSAA